MAELGRLESIYSRLPAPFQSAVFTAWGFKSRRDRFGGEFPQLLRSLVESDFDDPGKIRERQGAAVVAILKHAAATVPYYRKLLGKEPLTWSPEAAFQSLENLPVLAKATVKTDPSAFISSDFARRELVMTRTSGTTGTPLVVAHSKYAVRFQWAVWWRHRARFGIALGDPFLTFGARVPVLGRTRTPWRENLAIRQTYLVTSLLTGSVLDKALDLIRRRHFVFYTGYPSAMYILARAVLDRGIELETPPRMIFTGSDALTPTFRRTIESAFKAKISDNFGSAEMCGNLAQCPQGTYHVDHELGLVELLPVPGSDDPALRRMICTSLVNRAMPLIRYDLGDHVRVADGCTCGRSSQAVRSVEGRSEDFLLTPDGRLVTGLNQVLEWVPDILEAQIRQEELEAIDVLLVSRGPVTDEQRHVLHRELRKRVGDLVAIRIHRVDQIPRTANGKFRAVESRFSSVWARRADPSAVVNVNGA